MSKRRVGAQSRWYPVWLLAGLSAVMMPAILLAARGNSPGGFHGFDAVVRGIETRYHARATTIPFMGLASAIAGVSTHGAVHNLHLAEFENFKGDGDKPVDGDEFQKLVQERAGDGWSRMVRETSRTGDEQTLIYVRPEGKHVGMLVVDLDGHELDVVQISMNPDQLMKQMKEHEHHGVRDQDGHQQDLHEHKDKSADDGE